MSKRLVFLLITAIYFAPAATSSLFAKEVVERIVAVVNDEIITEQDVERTMAPVLAQYRTAYAGSEYDAAVAEARKEFIGKMVEDKLILSEAKRRQVIVKDEEVDEMMADVRNKFPNKDIFLKALEDQGMTEKKLWDKFKDQLMNQKFVNYEVKSKIAVSPGDVNDYYKAHAEDFAQNDRVKLQQILIRTTTRNEEEAHAFAKSLATQILSGTSFDELAKAYSEGAEAKEGGHMGWIEKGQFLGEIDEKIFSTEVGSFTAPIKSSLGYHIFKVLERQTSVVRPVSEVRDQIQDLLFKERLKQRLDAWVADLKKNAYISIREA